MDLLNRFLKYVKIDTMSDDTTGLTPSTNKQYDLANILVEELKELGLTNVFVDDNCTVFGTLEATNKDMDRIGFLAHMDTIPEVSGKNVMPKVIKNYDGSIIELGNNEKLDPNEFPQLKNEINHTLITTSGDTVLGADDKAGIAIIMTMLDNVIKNKVEHGLIKVAFTPDEEIGTGILSFNVDNFDVDYAYTIDGEYYKEFSYENFNAASAHVTFKGFEIHPGSAKNMMVNASKIAMEFNSLLPSFQAPEYTEGYEGFNHLTNMNGETGFASLDYILRNHSLELLEKQKNDFINAMNFINSKYGANTCIVEIKDSYKNMRQEIEKDMRCVDKALNSYKNLGIDVIVAPTRGGTDGARLTFMGIKTPNIGTGGYNCHGIHEYADLDEMSIIVNLITDIVSTK